MKAAQAQRVAIDRRVGGDGQAAAGAQAGEEGALGGDRVRAWARRRCCRAARTSRVSSARHCDGEDALADRRQHLFASRRPGRAGRACPGARDRRPRAPRRRTRRSATLRMRVSTLPRMLSTPTSGRIAMSCTARRRLSVPMRAPDGQLCERGAVAADRGRRGRRRGAGRRR